MDDPASSILFFFAAALMAHFAYPFREVDRSPESLSPLGLRRALRCALALSIVTLMVFTTRAGNAILTGLAQNAVDEKRSEQLYQAALALSPADAVTQQNYGMFLFYTERGAEAVPYLQYSVRRGFNCSMHYAYLAAAQIRNGDVAAAESTLRDAVKVYPRSTFLRARLASLLTDAGRTGEAESELAVGLSIDEPMTRGWWELIRNGRVAAGRAARNNPKITMPGDLFPEPNIYVVLAERREMPISRSLFDETKERNRAASAPEEGSRQR